jgi:hypothetical protein
MYEKHSQLITEYLVRRGAKPSFISMEWDVKSSQHPGDTHLSLLVSNADAKSQSRQNICEIDID